MRNFIIILIAAVAISIGFAYLLGFFTVSAEHQDGQIVANLTIHTAPIRHASESAEQGAKRIRDSVKDTVGEVTGTETVTGTVSDLDGYHQGFTLATSDQREMRIQIDPTTKVTGSQIRGLQPADRVTVVYKTTDGQHIARSITAE